jgi:predicted NBD/HSP70 family sugar kinase
VTREGSWTRLWNHTYRSESIVLATRSLIESDVLWKPLLGGLIVPAKTALVFDLGGTHLRCAYLRDEQFGNFTQQRIRSFRDGLSADAIWNELLDKIATYVSLSETLVERDAPLAISFPGPLQEDGRIVNAPTVTGLDTQVPDVRAELSRRTGRDVYLLNDVSAAAIHLARQTSWERFIVITISSGIGSKICDRTSGRFKLFDKGSYAGEIGHVVVDQSPSAALCDCGGKGHLGAIASGRGIELLARRQAIVDPSAFARSLCHLEFGASAEILSNEEHLVPSIRRKDDWALNVLEQACRPLSQVLTTVVLALGLQGIFVIGGFAFSIGSIYVELLYRLLRFGNDYSPLIFSPDMIKLGNLDEHACLRGAAEYAVMARDGHI